MHFRHCDPNRKRTAMLIASISGVIALVASASTMEAREPALRRLPNAAVQPAAAQSGDDYDPSRLFHNAWNAPGVAYYANWSDYSPDGERNAYPVNFQNPHDEEVPPPPGTEVAPAPSGGLAEDQTIGEEPVDNSVQFLRRQSVLLNHGDWQVDYGVSYTLSENDIPVAVLDGLGDVVGVVEGTAKSRLFLTPLEFRYGVTERCQAFVNVPMGWSHSELAFTDFDDFESEIGIGDVSAGLSMMLCEGCQYKPDVIATIGFTAPTGNADYPLLTSLIPNSQLGEGYWAATAQLLFIQTYDPIVLFWSFGYNHRFDADFTNPVSLIDETFQPGRMAFYQCGVGFGVNEWVTLSTSFAGAYISELYIDGDRVEGTIREPLRLRFAVTINKPDKVVEPFAEIGMTDDTVDARFGITWTHTHRRASCYGY